MKKVLITLLFLLLPVSAQAFEFKLVNNTNAKQIYNIWCMDWDPEPVIIAVGEMEPGETYHIDTDYRPGYYLIRWFNGEESNILVLVQENVAYLIVDQDSVQRILES